MRLIGLDEPCDGSSLKRPVTVWDALGLKWAASVVCWVWVLVPIAASCRCLVSPGGIDVKRLASHHFLYRGWE